MFERFTDRARRVLVLAQEEARLLGHSFIGTEHILLGLIHEGDGIAARALDSLGISLQSVRERVEETMGPAGTAATGSPPFTPRAKKVLELSLREALQLGHNYIGTEHLLLGLVREGEGVAAESLQSLGAELSLVRERVIELLGHPQVRSEPGPSVGRTDPGRDFPSHPTRFIPGPPERLAAESVEFRVIGLQCFDEGWRVYWRLSGLPKPLADLISDPSLVSVGLRRSSSAGYVSASDDAGTSYVQQGGTLDAGSGGELAGMSFFTPALPEGATRVHITWQTHQLAIVL